MLKSFKYRLRPTDIQSELINKHISSSRFVYNLDLVYSKLDSLQSQNSLNKIQFAEVIVSLIQDIPYSLILSDACDASIYNDKSYTTINEYARNKRQPSLEDLYKIAEILNVEVKELLIERKK